MNKIEENLRFIQKRIEDAALKSGRNPNEIKLLLATKTVSSENIKIALNLGETLIGENKVQELEQKFEALREIPHQTHFIGHLQSNKIKQVLKYVDCIQSVDRISLAKKLHKRLLFENRKLNVMLQVNTSQEESKFGVAPENALEFANEISKFETLKVQGLMTIGLFSSEEEKVRNCFKTLKKLQIQIQELNLPNFENYELSMGMSNDLEIAIEEGATMIRVGTAIFGERIYPDSYYWNENIKS